MLADDRGDYAMTCHMRFWFRGRFARPALEAALRTALARHPMLQATVAGRRAGPTSGLRWVRVPEPRLPFISWKAAAEPIEAPPGGMRSDLTADIGLRLWLREAADETVLLVQFHHAVCDGVGLFRFMEDLLTAYGALHGVPMPPMAAIDAAALGRRGAFGLSARDRWARLGLDLARALQFFKVLPSPLLAPRAPGAGRTRRPDLQAVVRAQLAEDRLQRLAAFAQSAGATLNDVMMRALFVALDEWNRRQAPQGPRRLIRIAMPTCLRQPQDLRLSAANVVSMVFLDRHGSALDDARESLAGIARETRFIKDNRMGLTLIRVMRSLGRTWGLLVGFMRAPLCSSTAVLTNLGKPFTRSPLAGPDGRIAVAGVVLEGLETLPPLRRKTRVAFSINSYGGPLRITMRYDTTIYSPENAREILRLFCRRLHQAPLEARAPAGPGAARQAALNADAAGCVPARA